MFSVSERLKKTSPALQSTRGMTLVEIMIVLTIMASIMTVVGFFAVGALDRAKVRRAETQIGQIAQWLDAYYIDHDEYPESLEDLTQPPSGLAEYTQEVPLDPWKNDYQYSRISDDEYEIFSMGSDEVFRLGRRHLPRRSGRGLSRCLFAVRITAPRQGSP